jgi:hypothetical protein
MLLRAWAHRPIFPVGGAVARLDMTARSAVLDGWMDYSLWCTYARVPVAHSHPWSMEDGKRYEAREVVGMLQRRSYISDRAAFFMHTQGFRAQSFKKLQ